MAYDSATKAAELKRQRLKRKAAARAHRDYLAKTDMGANKPRFCRHDRYYIGADGQRYVVPGGFPIPAGVKMLTPSDLKRLGIRRPISENPPYRARSSAADRQRHQKRT